MRLRNANKRAKKRKHIMFLLNGHRRIEDFIAERLRANIEKQLEEMAKRYRDAILNPQPSGTITGTWSQLIEKQRVMTSPDTKTHV